MRSFVACMHGPPSVLLRVTCAPSRRARPGHYEARQLCGWMIIHCRDLAMGAIAALDNQPLVRDRLCEVAVAFPVAFMLHLWGEPDTRGAAFTLMLDGVLDDATMQTVEAAGNRPLALLTLAQKLLNDTFRATAGQPGHVLQAAVYEQLFTSAKALGVPLGGCERIQGTPLPFVHVAHVRSLLIIVLCSCPLVYACAWQWATIPLSLIFAFGLLGIEAASVECERAFSATPTKNREFPVAASTPFACACMCPYVPPLRVPPYIPLCVYMCVVCPNVPQRAHMRVDVPVCLLVCVRPPTCVSPNCPIESAQSTQTDSGSVYIHPDHDLERFATIISLEVAELLGATSPRAPPSQATGAGHPHVQQRGQA